MYSYINTHIYTIYIKKYVFSIYHQDWKRKKIPCVKRYHVTGLQAIKVAVNDLQTSAILHQVDRLTYTTTRKKIQEGTEKSYTIIFFNQTSKYFILFFLPEENTP